MKPVFQDPDYYFLHKICSLFHKTEIYFSSYLEDYTVPPINSSSNSLYKKKKLHTINLIQKNKGKNHKLHTTSRNIEHNCKTLIFNLIKFHLKKQGKNHIAPILTWIDRTRMVAFLFNLSKNFTLQSSSKKIREKTIMLLFFFT